MYKVIILCVSIVLITQTTLKAQANRNYFLEDWEPRYYEEQEVRYPKSLSTDNHDATVTVFALDTIAPVLPSHFGVNTPFRNGDGMLTDGIRFPMYEQARLGAYRFPAGSGSNIFFWDGNIPDTFLIDLNPINGTQSTALKLETFADFIDSLGSQATVVVNYFYARYGVTPEGTREARVKQAAEYAAGFVHKMNVELGAGIKNWEVGNECYGAWEEGYDVNGSIVTGTEYGQDFRVFAEEMKKADSTIKVGAVLYTKDTDWNPQVIKEVENHADFFIIHDYFTSENDATIENILGSTGKIAEDVALLHEKIEQEISKPVDYFPIALTEFNCRGYHTTTMTNGMFITQILGEVIKNKLGMSTMWVSEWKWKADREPKAFLALQDPDQDDYTARPIYMPYHFYGKCFGDHMVNATVAGEGINAYASRFSSGEIGIVVVNTNSTSKDVKLSYNGFVPGGVEWYEVYSNTLNQGDKRFYINGQTGLTPGGGPEEFYNVAPYWAENISGKNIKVPAYSINFIVQKGITTSTETFANLRSVKVYPNPANYYIIIENAAGANLRIFDATGRKVYRATANSNNELINVSDLDSGVYLVIITNKEQTVTKRIFVQ